MNQKNIICNKCHNAILRESLVTCLTCDKTMKKMLTLKFDMDKLLTGKHNTRNKWFMKSFCICLMTVEQLVHYICKTNVTMPENLLYNVNEKDVDIENGQILLTGKHNTRNADIKQNNPLHMQDLPLTTPTKMYMCVLQHSCAERYM